MKATATRSIYVNDSSGRQVLLRKGESADVDGRTYSDSHMFVQAGYLAIDKSSQKPAGNPGRKPKNDTQTKSESGPESEADA